MVLYPRRRHHQFDPHVLLSSLRGASVAQWLASPPGDLQRPFCSGFEPRRPGLMEGLKARDHLVVDWLYTKTKPIFVCCILMQLPKILPRTQKNLGEAKNRAQLTL
ncbi:hypothetical protein PoB_004184300 [Plakobranchus ocellatus]|uniref:Uncharacterized protein n=1 Tax=Plakobranchus ocellatus TaxID=259542 RepID=A0AAV4B6V1_9GAST|nr:hypothetical protein PoB_004184300 [Plakobranchus ocellatus]